MAGLSFGEEGTRHGWIERAKLTKSLKTESELSTSFEVRLLFFLRRRHWKREEEEEEGEW